MEKPLPREIEADYERTAKESIEEQKQIETSDKVPFEKYRRRYLEHEKLKA